MPAVRFQAFKILLCGVLLGGCILKWPEPIEGADGDADTDADTDVDADADADGDGGGDGGPVPDDVIPQGTPSVDGSLDDWPALRFTLNATSAARAEGDQDAPPPADLSATFDLRWDGDYLYLGARLSDDQAQSDSPNTWEDDSVELYLDGNADSDPGFDANDHQYTTTRDGTMSDRGTEINPGSEGISVATTEDGAGQWSLEVAIPWSALGGAAEEGREIAVDVALNDDDDGGGGDSHLIMWLEQPAGDHPNQDTTQMPSFFLGL